jgi:hypothetical protein
MQPANLSDPAARSRALANLLLGEDTGLGQLGHDADWAQAVVAAGRTPQGWDPSSFPPGWLPALAAAGAPLARGGHPWAARISDQAHSLTLRSSGELLVPPLECFAILTSLALKPLRLFIHAHFGIRLQVAAGVHLWAWANQLVLINTTVLYRGGFIHGPQRGVRSVVALEPGQSQEISW